MVKKYLKNPLISASLFCCLIIYSGFFPVYEKNAFNCIIPVEDVVFVTGTIKSSPQITSKRNYYTVILDTEYAASLNLRAATKGNIKLLIPKDHIEALYPGKLYSQNPDNNIWESGANIEVYGQYKNGLFIASNAYNKGYSESLVGKINYIRALMRLQFKRLMYGWKDAGGLVLALLSGSREFLEKTNADNFRKAGLSHILALSGMHLAMIRGLGKYIGEKIGYKKLCYVLQLLFIIIFVWFAGFSPSLLRAFICAGFILFEEIINVRKSELIEVLAFSFIVQSILSPNDLQSMGFILSYGALAGILVTSDFFQMLTVRFLPYRLSKSLSTSMGAQSFTMPVSARVFGTITPFGIIASVIISPMITIFIYSSFVIMIITFICPPFLSIGGFFMQIQYTLIKKMVEFFANLPAIQIL